jgi:hypothetical protein
VAEGFLLGPNLLSQVRRTIDRVEGESIGNGFRRIPTVLEGEDGRRQTQTVFRIATFTGAWAIGAVKNVNLKYLPGATNTVNVTNLFAAVPNPGIPGDCAIAKEGTAWFLIAAVCETTA